MPAGTVKNLVYRAALPVTVRRPALTAAYTGEPLRHAEELLKLLRRERVQGASVLIGDGECRAQALVSMPDKPVGDDSLFRVASVTKMATALVILRLCAEGAFSLDTPAAALLPESSLPKEITLRQLLSHTSGLRDIPACDRALAEGGTFEEVLRAGAVQSAPGAQFAYCNFGFGLLGCVMESATGEPLPRVFERELLRPLGMNGAIDGSTVEETRIVPIRRVLSRRPQPMVTVTPLGRKPLTAADPLRHFGHTAGALYTDAISLDRLTDAVLGRVPGYLPETLLREMTAPQASYGRLDRRLRYGLGLLLVEETRVPGLRLIGHQGYAYGCVDGVFADPATGRRLISLNGGASEARSGRLGCVNHGLIRWAFGRELPSWM